jgi:hypothetical protein
MKENMTHDDMMTYLKDLGLKPVSNKDVSNLMVSSMLIRCQDADPMIVAMGSNRSKSEQINALVDAVHLHLQTRGSTGNLRLVLGKKKSQKVMAEIKNERDLQKPPQLALRLSELVDDSSFRWYRGVTGKDWSGRVEGLEVCKAGPDLETIRLGVGTKGKKGNGEARKEFLKIFQQRKEIFNTSEIHLVAGIIKELVESRRNRNLNNFQREHLLESRVLRGAEKLKVKGKLLMTVCREYPFQFPTLWAPDGKARYLDALMRLGEVPWAVELKEPNGSSRGQGYRHGITQAVLYREFIRRAKDVHRWFAGQKMNAELCEAAVAFPAMTAGGKQAMLFQQHQKVADAFGVEIVQIETG